MGRGGGGNGAQGLEGVTGSGPPGSGRAVKWWEGGGKGWEGLRREGGYSRKGTAVGRAVIEGRGRERKGCGVRGREWEGVGAGMERKGWKG